MVNKYYCDKCGRLITKENREFVSHKDDDEHTPRQLFNMDGDSVVDFCKECYDRFWDWLKVKP